MALNENTLTTTTLQYIRRRLVDNIFRGNPFLAWLLMNGRIDMQNGGKRIDIPLIYATNGTTMAYKGYDRLNVTPTDELTNAQFAWRQMATTMSISGLEELQNSGESAIFNMLKAKITVAEMSARQYMAEKVVQAPTIKDPTRDFLGIGELVELTPAATQSTVGGIDRATEQWWANQFTAYTVALGASKDLLTQNLNNSYLKVSQNLETPDLCLITQTLYQRYEDDNRQFIRLTDNKLADTGFDNIRFKGASMMWDANLELVTSALTGGQGWYWLNSKYFGVMMHTKRNFVMTNFMSPYDQDARVAQLLAAGNMTISNSRFQGAFTQVL